uniref:Uncharacterized protein n=1 Tax=Cannabis sativa TaxID=3483 RepID=A0A803QIT1_CANSA
MELDPMLLSTHQPSTQSMANQGLRVTLNLDYEHWIMSEQILMGWIYSSMTKLIATEIMGCATLAALWRALDRAHYIVKMVSRPNISWHEVQHLLLSFYSKLESLQGVNGNTKSRNVGLASSSSGPPINLAVTNMATKPKSNPNPSQGKANYNSYPGGNRGGIGGNRGSGYGISNNTKQICQVCDKYFHSATHYYNQYDEASMGQDPKTSQQPSGQGGGHAACSPKAIDNNIWYVGTGASNHITSTMSNLN